jgi:hypothetical protein
MCLPARTISIFLAETLRNANTFFRDLGMPYAAARLTFGSRLTSLFEIYPSNFASFPVQLFYSTQIPVCLWFLAKTKQSLHPI